MSWFLRIAAVILGALVLSMESFVLDRPVGVVRTPLRPDSFLVDDLDEGHRVSQTIEVRARGFAEIRLWVSALDSVANVGDVMLTLYELVRGREGGGVVDDHRFIYRDRVPGRVVVSQPTFVFRFPVIDESTGRLYRLDLRDADPNAQSGIGLWATDGRWSDGGSLFINGQNGYAELVFETRAMGATGWSKLRHRFGLFGLSALVLLTAGVHVALWVILRALMTLAPTEPQDRL